MLHTCPISYTPPQTTNVRSGTLTFDDVANTLSTAVGDPAVEIHSLTSTPVSPHTFADAASLIDTAPDQVRLIFSTDPVGHVAAILQKADPTGSVEPFLIAPWPMMLLQPPPPPPIYTPPPPPPQPQSLSIPLGSAGRLVLTFYPPGQ